MTHALAGAPDEHDVRARELLARMTLREKVAQIVGFWVDEGGTVVAPMQQEMTGTNGTFEAFAAEGLGHLTRVYGTSPVEPVERAAWLRDAQRWLRTQTRLGIPALVHEECLTGLAAWKAASVVKTAGFAAPFDHTATQLGFDAVGRL